MSLNKKLVKTGKGIKPCFLREDNIKRKKIRSINRIIYILEENIDNIENINIIYDKEWDSFITKYFYSSRQDFENLTYDLSESMQKKACNLYNKMKIMRSNDFSEEVKDKLDAFILMFDSICAKKE